MDLSLLTMLFAFIAFGLAVYSIAVNNRDR